MSPIHFHSNKHSIQPCLPPQRHYANVSKVLLPVQQHLTSLTTIRTAKQIPKRTNNTPIKPSQPLCKKNATLDFPTQDIYILSAKISTFVTGQQGCYEIGRVGVGNV